ncbi:MAG: hypothetical protein GW761_12135 [Leptospira sp.]|nr:hypothetical protein [Leptospira sp.]
MKYAQLPYFHLSIILFIFALTGITAKDKPTQALKFVIEDSGIQLNDNILKADRRIDFYEGILGKYNITENRADGLYYTWDKLGIKLREDGNTKSINQITLFLSPIGTSATKSPYKGKLSALGKDITFQTNPSKISKETICEQIFCAFDLESLTVYVNLTSDKKKIQYIQMVLP